MGSEKELPQIFSNFIFPKIFQTFRIAIHPTKLIIGLAAILIIWLAGWLMDFSKTVITAPGNHNNKGVSELQAYINNPVSIEQHIKSYKQNGAREGVFSTLWDFAVQRFHSILISASEFDTRAIINNLKLYLTALQWALKYHPLYCVIFFIIKLITIAIAGGTICRITAMQFARGEKPGLVESLKFGVKKFRSFVTAPILPYVLVILVGFIIFLFGLICNIPRAGEIITGISMPFVFTVGALITVTLVGTTAGFNLIYPAIAYDGSDSFDAISRAFSYVFARPWRMFIYTFIASIYGIICYFFARLLIFLLLWSTRLFLSFGMWKNSSSGQTLKINAIWPKPNFLNLFGTAELITRNWSESIGAFLIHLFVAIAVGLLVSFLISFYFSANTIIYSLLRYRADNVKIEDIYVPAENHTEAEVKTVKQPSAQ